ncbi:MAG: hypothetical protein KDA85_17675, partial [Planctomycetaceae bacterium]|nr:hypothetical protein [Planctomycetaceae bacterium]
SVDALLQLAEHAVAGMNHQQQIPVLCFDDAHQLSVDVIQQVVQPLLNLADRSNDLQLSVILSGQPVLLSQLARLPQVNERIAMLATLEGFTANEIREFLTTSLEQAGGSPSIFTPEAIQRLFELSAGIPRRLIRLADMALLVGFAEQLDAITNAEVDCLAHELLTRAA